ncbi:hypothetical protein N656DRAFT_794382 [Canariomyces notabilis]|uniref:Uncharacterized protein n=1 Tax=Canariomyces notabilis TaxID=2074819 RepID=A0AAN6TKF4_9PEZI|nr:hypothetical protein N656DRAFT_794382 [Canariomyces arenarius]
MDMGAAGAFSLFSERDYYTTPSVPQFAREPSYVKHRFSYLNPRIAFNAIRSAYSPTWDIEADEGEEEYTEPAVDLQIPERAKLAEILGNQPDNLSSAELLELRIQAAELMASLCDKRETRKRDRIRQRARTDVAAKEESPGLDPFPLLMEEAMPTLYRR